MGRRRSTNLHLPAGVYVSRGWHFWRDARSGQWRKLGKDWDRAAKLKYAELSTGKAAEGTVSELLDAFLAHCEQQVRVGKRSAATYDVNTLEAGKLKATFGRMHYADVTSKHVATYIRKRTDKNGRPTPIRANRELAFLSSAYSWAMGDDRYEVTTNPCYGVRRNVERPRDRYVETGELRQFTKGFAPEWMRCYVLLKRLTALRQADMLRLDDANLTDRGIELAVGKTGRRIIFRWTWALRKVVKAAQTLRPEVPEATIPLRRPLFVSRYETQMTSRGFKSAWQRAMQAYSKAGHERFWEHDIRAKSASDSKDIEAAQQLLDHTTTTTTQRYRRAPSKVRPLR